MTLLLRVCLVQELGDIQDSHTLQCPQGNEPFPECSSVFHLGGVFQCTCLEVSPSVWVCLTPQRSSALGRAVKYFPNKLWRKAARRRNGLPRRTHSCPGVHCSKEKKTSNLQIQVWPRISWGVHLDMCRVTKGTWQNPHGGEMVAQRMRAAGWVSETLDLFLTCLFHPQSLPLRLPAVSNCLGSKAVTWILSHWLWYFN